MYLSIRERATHAIKWSALSHWITRGAQLLILFLMARILQPSEYGIFEIIILVLTLAQILQEFGLGLALIQTELDEDLAANVVFWTNIILSVIVYGTIYGFAPYVANFFGESTVTHAIRVAGLQLVIFSFRSVPLALAQRHLKYRHQFIAGFLGSLAMVISAGGFLITGFRLWAFIYSLLIGATVQTTIFWLISPWRPSFHIETDIGRSLLRFGGLTMIEAFQGWLLNYGDSVIVGYFLGVETLGVYGLGYKIAVYSFTIILQPLSSVAYSALTSLKLNIAEISRAFLNIIRFLALIILPIGIGLALVADPVARVVLDGRWPGITPVIQLLALFPGISHLLLINPELFRAIGRPDIMPKLLLATIIYSLPVYVIGTQFGLLGFIVARISITVIFFPVHVLLISRFARLGFSQLWECVKVPLVASLSMALIIFGLFSFSRDLHDWQGWVQLGCMVLFGAISYGLAIWLLDKDLLIRAFKLVKQVILTKNES